MTAAAMFDLVLSLSTLCGTEALLSCHEQNLLSAFDDILIATSHRTGLSFFRNRLLTLKGFLSSLIRRIKSLVLFSRCSGESSSRKVPFPAS